jgi:hypothetical protein
MKGNNREEDDKREGISGGVDDLYRGYSRWRNISTIHFLT